MVSRQRKGLHCMSWQLFSSKDLEILDSKKGNVSRVLVERLLQLLFFKEGEGILRGNTWTNILCFCNCCTEKKG